ncbi:MAG: hypothetical protein B6240_08255 [Desulfobacteraceae bacterium 4572_87]|nr:MAG: hypothetical protein B6240_08255 [Desulfobacteraceae bacterium 4572_87]
MGIIFSGRSSFQSGICEKIIKVLIGCQTFIFIFMVGNTWTLIWKYPSKWGEMRMFKVDRAALRV